MGTKAERGDFIKELKAHWIIKVIAILWSVASVVSTGLAYAPPAWQQAVSLSGRLPLWPWYIWVIGFLALGIAALFESSYRAYARRESHAEPVGAYSAPTARQEIANSGNVTGGSATATTGDIHLHLAPLPPPPPAPKATTTPEAPVSTHNVQLIRPKKVYVEPGYTTMGHYERNVPTKRIAFVACFQNKPVFGDNIKNVYGVTATASYFDVNGNQLYEGIAGLSWLGDDHDAVNFEVGGNTHDVILAIVGEGGRFYVPCFKRTAAMMHGYHLVGDYVWFDNKEIARISLWLIGGNATPLLPESHFLLTHQGDEWNIVKQP